MNGIIRRDSKDGESDFRRPYSYAKDGNKLLALTAELAAIFLGLQWVEEAIPECVV